MAAGDLALLMLLSASDMISPTVVSMTSTFDDSLLSMTDATVALSDYLTSLGEQTFTTGAGFDGLAASADAVDVSLTALDTSASSTGTSLTAIDASAASADTALASLAADAASVDVSLSSLDATTASVDTSLAALDASAASAAVSLAATDASLASTGVSAASASTSLDTVAASEAAAGDAAELSSSKMMGVGMVVAGIVLAAGAAGVASLKMAADFETSTNTLVTGAGESASNLTMVRQGILQTSVATGTMTKDLVNGMFMIESAGYHGAAGLNVLTVAAEGAKVGNADLGVVANALTTVLTDYHMKGTQAAQAMNALTATVASGKTHLQDLASSLGAVLPLASALGISFPQVAGGIAVMTNAGMSAQHASQNLANAIRSLAAPNGAAQKSMTAVGLSAQQLKDTLSNQGLAAAIQLVENHVGKTFPAGSVAAVTAFKNIMGGATGYNVALMLGGKNMAAYQANIATITGAMKTGGTTVTGWATVQGSFNQKLSQAQAALQAAAITIGTQLLPAVSGILGAITPLITRFAAWASQGDNLKNMLPILGGALAGFAVIIMALVIPAIISMGASLLAMEVMGAPVILIVLAVIAVVALIIVVIQHWGQIVAWLGGVWNAFTAWFGSAMSAMGSFFHAVWDATAAFFVAVWTATVSWFVSTWNAFTSWFGSAMSAIGTFFRTVWTGIVNFFVGTWNSIVAFFVGIWNDIVNAVQTAIQTVVGWFVWLYNHNYYFKDLVDGIVILFNAAKAFLIMIWTTITAWLANAWNTIKNTAITVWTDITTAIHVALTTAWNWIVSVWTTVTTWISAHWQYLTTLATFYWNLLVTIIQWKLQQAQAFITSIWNTVVAFLLGIWNRITSQVSSAWSKIALIFGSAWSTYIAGPMSNLWNAFTSWFTNLISQVGQWGANMMQGFINGITGMIGNLKGALGNVMSTIAGFLGFHSPTKEGEGRYIVEWGAGMVKGFVQGMMQAQPLLTAQISHMISAPNTIGYGGSGNAGAGNAFALGGGQTIVVQVQPVAASINVDGKKMGQANMQYQGKEVRIQGGWRNS